MPVEDQSDLPSSVQSVPSIQLRWKFFLTGVVFPIACFVAACMGMEASIDRPWQTGQLKDYLAMLFVWPSFAPVLPIIGYSMACLTIWVVRPQQASEKWIRVGLYGGVVLAVQFLICLFFVSSIMTLTAAVFVGPILAIVVWGSSKSGKLAQRFTIRHLLILTTVSAIVISVLLKTKAIESWDDFRVFFYGVTFWCIAAAPTLNLITYARASVSATALASNAGIGKRQWLKASGVAMIAAWLLSWIVSWKFAVDLMLLEYSKLPTADPNCYVSSAAAHGHRKLVGSECCGDGRVSYQMQQLKFLEFAFAAALPRCHRLLRKLYNIIGPSLAKLCASNVWFADATYLLLKPIEFLAWLIRVAAGVPANKIHDIYRS